MPFIVLREQNKNILLQTPKLLPFGKGLYKNKKIRYYKREVRAVQICLFDGKEEFKAHLKEYEQYNDRQRIRYDVPTYIKFYSLYQYDRQKFRELLNIWLKTDEGKNRTIETLKAKQDEILKLCYNVDENGKPLKDSDEMHIYRYATMQRIYEAIYQTLIERGLVSVLTQGVYEYDRFIINAEEMQAEVKGTALKSLNDRLKIHIQALRELRNGQTSY